MERNLLQIWPFSRRLHRRRASLRSFGRVSGHGPGIQKSVSTEHVDRHPPHSTTTDLGIAMGTAGHDRAEALKGPKRRRLAAPRGDSLIARARAVDDDPELTPQSATGNRAWHCGRMRARLYGEATSDMTCMPYMPAIRMVHGRTSPRSRSQAEGSRSQD